MFCLVFQKLSLDADILAFFCLGNYFGYFFQKIWPFFPNRLVTLLEACLSKLARFKLAAFTDSRSEKNIRIDILKTSCDQHLVRGALS
jgi:hypothetical protein